ncbi:MAG: carboxypeptidase M32 [Spirochaetales bacterium]|nr:carboxypeptidase M32 [Spirochaetales bacterium]
MNIGELKEYTRDIYHLSRISALLGWDQETCMPSRAIEERGDQIALIQGLIHDRLTHETVGSSLGRLADAPLSDLDRRFAAKLKRDYDRSTRLPKALVTGLAKAASSAQAAWARARENNDWSLFEPHLETIISLIIEKAEAIGYEGHVYDALIDEYEPGMTVETLEQLLVGQAPALSGLVKRIAEKPAPDDSFLQQPYDTGKQEAFSRFILKEFGFPLDRGRLDVTAHPFTTSLGADDVRITTRYLPGFFNSAIFGTIHEAGHGFYELGFGDDIRGTILAEGASLGMHESQSRTWENLIGRSRGFWERYYPKLQQLFPENLAGVGLESFYKAVNKVERSFIRVEADEVTYNLHIILRYMLEKSLVAGQIPVRDLPEAWNMLCTEYFGMTPTSFREGVLQDIHWSMGAVGYFPTYALGNLIASQLASVMEKSLGSMNELVKSGEFPRIHAWLHDNIHVHGAAATPGELITAISGKPLSVDPFMDYIGGKYTRLYSL